MSLIDSDSDGENRSSSMLSSMCSPASRVSTTATSIHWATSTPIRKSTSIISTSSTTSSPYRSNGINNSMMPTRKSGGWSPPRRPLSAPGNHRLSAPIIPSIETEEEYVEFYQSRIYSAQQRQLFPLQEDLADWLNKLLDTNDITAENFMSALDDGIVVCRLAKYIQQEAKVAVAEGRGKGSVPVLGGRIWQNAAKRSFFSRDNTENFIKFCKQLGVHQNLIFESDDLVMHGNPRNVVLCLLEVSRLAAARFGLEASGLVQLEREIAECASPFNGGTSPVPGATLSDSGLSANSILSWRPASPPPPPVPEDDDDKNINSISGTSAFSLGSPGSSGRWSRPGSADEDDYTDGWRLRRKSVERSPSPIQEDRGLTELDRKVEQAARTARRQCKCNISGGGVSGKCEKLQVRRLGAGKYNIAGRNVFVRLLKGRHMMVRVGGGWDTLEHFLERHDPCQVRLSRTDLSSASLGGGGGISSAAIRRQSSPAITQRGYPPPSPSEGFLHIRAKYRSPPPARS